MNKLGVIGFGILLMAIAVSARALPTDDLKPLYSNIVNNYNATFWEAGEGLTFHNYLLTVQNLDTVNARFVNVSALLDNTTFDAGASNITLWQWNNQSRLIAVANQTCVQSNTTPSYAICSGTPYNKQGTFIDWQLKPLTKVQGNGNQKGHAGLVNVPKLNSVSQTNDKNNGTVYFKINYKFPFGKTQNGWGSGARAAALIDGVDVHPAWNNSWRLCMNITLTESGRAKRTTEPVEFNFTGLTINNGWNEPRIIDAACNAGGNEIASQVLSTDNSTWAKIVFLANATMGNGTNTTYSIYYNYSSASAPNYATDLVQSTAAKTIKNNFVFVAITAADASNNGFAKFNVSRNGNGVYDYAPESGALGYLAGVNGNGQTIGGASAGECGAVRCVYTVNGSLNTFWGGNVTAILYAYLPRIYVNYTNVTSASDTSYYSFPSLKSLNSNLGAFREHSGTITVLDGTVQQLTGTPRWFHGTQSSPSTTEPFNFTIVNQNLTEAGRWDLAVFYSTNFWTSKNMTALAAQTPFRTIIAFNTNSSSTSPISLNQTDSDDLYAQLAYPLNVTLGAEENIGAVQTNFTYSQITTNPVVNGTSVNFTMLVSASGTMNCLLNLSNSAANTTIRNSTGANLSYTGGWSNPAWSCNNPESNYTANWFTAPPNFTKIWQQNNTATGLAATLFSNLTTQYIWSEVCNNNTVWNFTNVIPLAPNTGDFSNASTISALNAGQCLNATTSGDALAETIGSVWYQNTTVDSNGPNIKNFINTTLNGTVQFYQNLTVNLTTSSINWTSINTSVHFSAPADGTFTGSRPSLNLNFGTNYSNLTHSLWTSNAQAIKVLLVSSWQQDSAGNGTDGFTSQHFMRKNAVINNTLMFSNVQFNWTTAIFSPAPTSLNDTNLTTTQTLAAGLNFTYNFTATGDIISDNYTDVSAFEGDTARRTGVQNMAGFDIQTSDTILSNSQQSSRKLYNCTSGISGSCISGTTSNWNLTASEPTGGGYTWSSSGVIWSNQLWQSNSQNYFMITGTNQPAQSGGGGGGGGGAGGSFTTIAPSGSNSTVPIVPAGLTGFGGSTSTDLINGAFQAYKNFLVSTIFNLPGIVWLTILAILAYFLSRDKKQDAFGSYYQRSRWGTVSILFLIISTGIYLAAIKGVV